MFEGSGSLLRKQPGNETFIKRFRKRKNGCEFYHGKSRGSLKKIRKRKEKTRGWHSFVIRLTTERKFCPLTHDVYPMCILIYRSLDRTLDWKMSRPDEYRSERNFNSRVLRSYDLRVSMSVLPDEQLYCNCKLCVFS